MAKSKAGIYTLYNTDKKRYYIGQTSDLKRRETDHFTALKKGTHYCKKMQEDYNNGDNISFIVITYCPNIERLLRSEETRIMNNYMKRGLFLYNRLKPTWDFDFINQERFFELIADRYCREHTGKCLYELAHGKNPARYDYLYRLLTRPDFDEKKELEERDQIGFYFATNPNTEGVII